MTKCPRSTGAEKIHDLILSGLNPHRKQWKNNEQSEQQTLYVLSSLEACTVMEMRLKTNMGEHCSWTRQLQLTILSLTAATQGTQGRLYMWGKYRVVISLNILSEFNNAVLGVLCARYTFHKASKHCSFFFCEFMWP